MTKTSRGIELPFGAFAYDAEADVAVGSRLASGVRTEEIHLLQGHHTVESLQARLDSVRLCTQVRW